MDKLRKLQELDEAKGWAYLVDEMKNNRLLRHVWRSASGHCSDNYKIALNIYAIENQDMAKNVYDKLNKECRELSTSSWNDFHYKGLAYFLLKAFVEEPFHKFPITLFRGVKLNIDQLDPPCSLDSILCFGQMTSSSELKSRAEFFAGRKGTVFEIEFNSPTPYIIDMRPYSNYADEEEYLISPFCQFEVISICPRPGRMDYVKLRYWNYEDRFVAAMVLSGVGNAMGFKNGEWEFRKNGLKKKQELDELGGVRKLHITKDWNVSSDTVLHLATAEGLVEAYQDDISPTKMKIYKEIACKYLACMSDMSGRALGGTCQKFIKALNPTKDGGLHNAFNARGGGCGAAMRAMCIGLLYSRPQQIQDLVAVSIESGRMSHHHPTGYLGALAAALFTSFALQDKPLKEWGKGLMATLEEAKRHIKEEGRFSAENEKHWPFFEEKWSAYLEKRNLANGTSEPSFPEKFGIEEREPFYKDVSFDGIGGSSGHDAPLIAYDALLGAEGDWEQLCERGILHGGDSDTTGVIAAAWYGALYGFGNVPYCNYQHLEYRERLASAGKAIYAIQLKKNGGKKQKTAARHATDT